MKTDNGGFLLPLCLGIAVFLLFNGLHQQSYEKRIQELQGELQQTEMKFQSYREGVMSHD